MIQLTGLFLCPFLAVTIYEKCTGSREDRFSRAIEYFVFLAVIYLSASYSVRIMLAKTGAEAGRAAITSVPAGTCVLTELLIAVLTPLCAAAMHRVPALHEIRWPGDVIGIFGLAMIVLGVYTSVVMDLTDRSLWLDESMLAVNIVGRSLRELTATPLAHQQTAPVVFLYISKIATILFGNTAFVLRFFSIVSYALTILLVFLLSRDALHLRFPVLPAAFAVNMTVFLKYSNDFKQYMGEAFWCLLALYVYGCYADRQEKTKKDVILLTLLFMFLILAANPSCFVIGGILLFEMLRAVMKADRKRAGRCLAAGAGAAACFAAYYFLWLKGGNTSYMQNYWNNMAIRVLPVNMDTWAQDAALFRPALTMLAGERWLPVFCVLAGAGIILTFFRRNRLGPVIVLSLFLACAASVLHMFPVTERLWVFSYPLLVLMIFYAAEELSALLQKALKAIPQKEKTREMTAAAICAATAVTMAFMVFANSGIVYYSDTENVYWDGEETASLIRYVQQHVTDGEKVFVYNFSTCAFDFYEGSATNRIGSVSEDNVIRSTGFPTSRKSLRKDVKAIQEAGKCWIISSHVINGGLGYFTRALKKSGTMDVAYVSHGTYLYYYEAAGK